VQPDIVARSAKATRKWHLRTALSPGITGGKSTQAPSKKHLPMAGRMDSFATVTAESPCAIPSTRLE
jgi:hypothetical protein